MPHCPRTDGRYKKKYLEDHPRRLWESAERNFGETHHFSMGEAETSRMWDLGFGLLSVGKLSRHDLLIKWDDHTFECVVTMAYVGICSTVFFVVYSS